MVGAGKLIHEQLNANRSIQQRIEFIRPFKSICSVRWTFSEVDGNTEVHWIMQGKMPFLLRFMTKMTVEMITKDYDLGLLLLNGFMNSSNEHPRYKFCGEDKLASIDYIFRSFKGYQDDMAGFKQSQLPLLVENAKTEGIADGKPLTIYHKAGRKKMYFECDLAIPVTQRGTEPSQPVKTLPEGKYYRIDCLGDYRFLELAWYKALCHVKMLKLKIDKSMPYLEVYQNNPDEVEHSNEVLTTIYLPIK